MKKFALFLAALSFSQGVFAAALSLTTIVINDEKENLLADSFQRTLYVFDQDKGMSASACVGDCAELWPPYIIDATEAKTLVAPLGAMARTNGKLQLTFNAKPVYTYSMDRKIGDDKGDGLGKVWHYIELKKEDL